MPNVVANNKDTHPRLVCRALDFSDENSRREREKQSRGGNHNRRGWYVGIFLARGGGRYFSPFLFPSFGCRVSDGAQTPGSHKRLEEEKTQSC